MTVSRSHLAPLVALAMLAVLIPLAGIGASARHQQPVMYAHFINMGQADCTLLEFPCGAVLIDAGSQSAAHTQALVEYLDSFFSARPHLARTLEAVYITHAHIDHTSALTALDENFTIHRLIDNGLREGKGAAPVRRIVDRVNAGQSSITIRQVSEADISPLPHRRGITDATIDPLQCALCDPQIHILAGQMPDDVGWTHGAFSNYNNHSLVIRVDFGEASFLFTGDLEEPAIETLVEYYGAAGTLDVDVYQVGHHGSLNGTTESLLQAMSPHIAVISMGHWEFGRRPDGTAQPFTTFGYGHPRKPILDMLQAHIPTNRSRAVTIMVAVGARNFEEYTVRRRIYATGWDGTVKIRATLDRRYRVTNH